MEESLERLGFFTLAVTAIVGLIGFIARRIIVQVLNKDLEKFKSNLEAEQRLAMIKIEKEIKNYELNLNLINSKQSLLHQNRWTAILEFYRKVVNLHMLMSEITSPVKTVSDPKSFKEREIKELEEIAYVGNDLAKYYRDHKIYFKEDLCRLMDDIQENLRKSYRDISFKYEYGIPSSQMTIDMVREAQNRIRGEVPKLIRELEHEFRRIIGVTEGNFNWEQYPEDLNGQ